MGGQGLGRVAFIVMIVMVLCNSVQVQSISQCVVECQQLCAGSEDPQCSISCLKNKCDKQPPAAVYYCSLGCATYRCTDFSTSEKVGGCVVSCSNNCSKFYGLRK
ncbi:hypothetical protein TIFTF001_006679 [Ficus carica]|uniref:Thionin-like protein n=1 Tax=Ficus carica TaxID=3494 RepID=A0AA87ZNB9_FICCA|nr:hypothetical protein TIFTF001_006679 [Ficus carica]